MLTVLVAYGALVALVAASLAGFAVAKTRGRWRCRWYRVPEDVVAALGADVAADLAARLTRVARTERLWMATAAQAYLRRVAPRRVTYLAASRSVVRVALSDGTVLLLHGVPAPARRRLVMLRDRLSLVRADEGRGRWLLEFAVPDTGIVVPITASGVGKPTA